MLRKVRCSAFGRTTLELLRKSKRLFCYAKSEVAGGRLAFGHGEPPVGGQLSQEQLLEQPEELLRKASSCPIA